MKVDKAPDSNIISDVKTACRKTTGRIVSDNSTEDRS